MVSRTATSLYLLRHAHAGDPARWEGPDDRRPLSGRGRRQAEAIAEHLAGLSPGIEVIVSSPKLRAVQTAEFVARALGLPINVDDRLAAGLSIGAAEQVLASVGDPDAAVLVGHDPDFSELVADLVGAPSIPMRKGALARLDTARPVHPGSAILRWLLPPDAIEKADRTRDRTGERAH
ncbi:MAG TPA: histidine phosphatase family protein [Candidatus Saccharimonadales bacterium]|nr:histidine phosphatase family protein [Candidatus Saccharimonadales bacterium]